MTKAMKRMIALALLLAGVNTANAQSACQFSQSGIPMATNMTFHASKAFPGLAPERALANLAQQASSSGLIVGFKVDRRSGTISGANRTEVRPFPFRMTVRRAGDGSRVDYNLTIWAGRIFGNAREQMCRALDGARG